MPLKEDIKKQLEDLLDDLNKQAEQYSKKSVFCIGTTMNRNNEEYFFSALRHTASSVYFKIMLSHLNDLDQIIRIADGRVDEVSIDVEEKKKSCKELVNSVLVKVLKSKVSFFRGNQAAALAFEQIFFEYCLLKKVNVIDRNVLIIGVGHLGIKIAAILMEYRINVYIYDKDIDRSKKVMQAIDIFTARNVMSKVNVLQNKEECKANNYVSIVGATDGVAVIDEDLLELLSSDGFIVDVGLATLTEEAIKTAADRNIDVFCLMAESGYETLDDAKEKARKIASSMKRRNLSEGFAMVSGGIIGRFGDIIVDDALEPTQVIAVAKGNGLVLFGSQKDEFLPRIQLVKDKYLVKAK